MPLGSFKSWMIQNYLSQYPGPSDLWALWLPSLSKWTKWLMPNIILKRLWWLIQYPGLEQTHQILHFRKWLTCVRISKWISWLQFSRQSQSHETSRTFFDETSLCNIYIIFNIFLQLLHRVLLVSKSGCRWWLLGKLLEKRWRSKWCCWFEWWFGRPISDCNNLFIWYHYQHFAAACHGFQGWTLWWWYYF